MRFLALDYGSARIGLAIGDSETRIASPWGTIRFFDPEQVANELEAVIRTERIDRLILGLPRPLHDQAAVTRQAEEIQQFGAWLTGRLNLPMQFENETWSSQLAARHMRDRDERGKRDDLAAAIILQSFLDRGYGVS